MQVDFDPDRLELTINSNKPFPKVSVFNQIDSDMFGNVSGEAGAPGPIADPGAKRQWQLDPLAVV